MIKGGAFGALTFEQRKKHVAPDLPKPARDGLLAGRLRGSSFMKRLSLKVIGFNTRLFLEGFSHTLLVVCRANRAGLPWKVLMESVVQVHSVLGPGPGLGGLGTNNYKMHP